MWVWWEEREERVASIRVLHPEYLLYYVVVGGVCWNSGVMLSSGQLP